jgi:hypothetical protein
MKKIIFGAVVFIAGLVIYSCSSTAYVEKKPGLNFSDYKTYMWVDIMADEKDVSARTTAFADLSVHNAANEELQRWGWRETSENPDVLVSYDILVERNVETQNDPVYTQPYSRSYYNRFTKKWSTIYYPSQFLGYQQYEVPVREATITITLIDTKNDQKIWQGWTTERLGSSGITNLDVKKSVRNVFKESGNANRNK